MGMGDIQKENECFQQDYEELYAKGKWNADDLERMKNYKKLIYYNLAVEAMQNGEGHPGKGHLPEMSYSRGRDSMGQFTSGMSSHPYYPNMGGGVYYDSERAHDEEKAAKTLRWMLDNTDDPERRAALKFAINTMNMR